MSTNDTSGTTGTTGTNSTVKKILPTRVRTKPQVASSIQDGHGDGDGDSHGFGHDVGNTSGHGSGPLPGREVPVVQTGTKTKFVTRTSLVPQADEPTDGRADELSNPDTCVSDHLSSLERTPRGRSCAGALPGVSRTKLAKVLGCHKSAVSNVLSGQAECSREMLRRMAEHLGLTVEEMTVVLAESRRKYLRGKLGLSELSA